MTLLVFILAVFALFLLGVVLIIGTAHDIIRTLTASPAVPFRVIVEHGVLLTIGCGDVAIAIVASLHRLGFL